MPEDDFTSEIPEDIVRSVLAQSGFGEEVTPVEPTTPDPVEPPVNEPVAGDQEGDQGSGSEPPLAPGGPLFTPEEDEANQVTLPDGRKIPLSVVQEWADRGTTAPSAPTPVTPEPTPTPTPEPQAPAFAFPQVTEEDIEMGGPAVRALLMIADRQAQEMKKLAEQVSEAKKVQQQVAEVEASKVLNAATSAFKQEYSLPDDLMTKIADHAVPDDVTRHLRANNDPYEAVKYALQRSYWDLPEAKQFEFERQYSARLAAQTRKQKLGGVSGTGGPTTRGAPPIDESTPEGRHQAAVELVRQAMYGEGEG